MNHEAQGHIERWIKDGGLDWDVLESPVFFYAKPTALREAKTRKVLYRSDTLEPLSVVGTRYKPVQPRALLEFYQSLIEDFGFEIESCGSFRDGAKVWALARTGDTAFINGVDGIKSYLLLATSYDTSLATTGTFTSLRVWCENSLAYALAHGVNSVRIGHHAEFNPIEVKDQLGLGHDAWLSFKTAAETLARISLNAEQARTFYQKALRVTPDATTADARVAAALTQRFETHSYIAPEDTAWGALNNLTEFYDHARRERAPGNRLHSAWFGAGAAVKQAAWEEAVALI